MFFFKQKTAYEMRISDWSSDVCSSDLSMYLVCYLRRGSDVFETYWTTRRGVEAMDNSYRLLDLTIYGRQEEQEISPPGWPQNWGENDTVHTFRSDGSPMAQWPSLAAGFLDDLGN